MSAPVFGDLIPLVGLVNTSVLPFGQVRWFKWSAFYKVMVEAGYAEIYDPTEPGAVISVPVTGVVLTYAALPTTGLTPGAVYMVQETGRLYMWSGTAWPPADSGILITGTPGPPGPPGPPSTVPGPPGPANSLSIGTVTQGTAEATITGTAPAQTLNLVLPKGDPGEPGPPGDAGTPATSTVAGVIRLTGDLGGTADSPTVPGLAGKADREFGEVIASYESGDFNTLDFTTPGVYRVRGGTGFVANAPSTTDLWWNVLVAFETETASKLLIATSTSSGSVYAKVKYGVTWGGWINITAPYTAMTVSEGTTGTSTATRAVRADYLKQTINHYITGASGTSATAFGQSLAVLADAAAGRTALAAEGTANKGVANGYAPLDSSGFVPSTNLPSYVDDVLEYANLAAFPATGATGKIYIALDTNKVYRWGGSSYTEISPSPGSTDAVPEGSTNKYFTDARAQAALATALAGKVDTTGAQTIGGVKTFSSIPVLPNTDPALANEATRKSYVDMQVATKYTKPGAGIPSSDLATAVQTSLSKADTAAQAADIAAAQLVGLSAQTGAYALVLADATKAVEVNSATGVNVTVPPNSSVAFPVGTVIELAQIGAGKITVVAGAGVTINSAASLISRAQWSTLALRKRATDTWILTGDMQ